MTTVTSNIIIWNENREYFSKILFIIVINGWKSKIKEEKKFKYKYYAKGNWIFFSLKIKMLWPWSLYKFFFFWVENEGIVKRKWFFLGLFPKAVGNDFSLIFVFLNDELACLMRLIINSWVITFCGKKVR